MKLSKLVRTILRIRAEYRAEIKEAESLLRSVCESFERSRENLEDIARKSIQRANELRDSLTDTIDVLHATERDLEDANTTIKALEADRNAKVDEIEKLRSGGKP